MQTWNFVNCECHPFSLFVREQVNLYTKQRYCHQELSRHCAIKLVANCCRMMIISPQCVKVIPLGSTKVDKLLIQCLQYRFCQLDIKISLFFSWHAAKVFENKTLANRLKERNGGLGSTRAAGEEGVAKRTAQTAPRGAIVIDIPFGAKI